MKILSTLLIGSALCLAACAQFTTIPPEIKRPDFHWTTNAPGFHDPGFHWGTNAARRMPDASTRDFFHRAHLTNGQEMEAVADLVRDLKNGGVWTNLIAFYPMVGSSSNSCAQNLLSASYTITWYGTNTFNALGVTGDGKSGYGDTGYNPRTMGADNYSFHLYTYYATNGSTGGPLVGVRDSSLGDGNHGAVDLTYNAGWRAIYFDGVFYGSSSGNDWALGKNFLLQRTDDVFSEAISDVFRWQRYGLPGAIEQPPNTNILVLSLPYGGGFGNVNVRAISFGKALSHAQVTNYFNAVTRFQTVLGRATP